MTDRLNQYSDFTKWLELNTDVGMLSESERELLKTCLNKDWSVPRYKMRWFQGQAQITKWGVFRQYMIEMRGREEIIEKLDYEIAKAEADIEIHTFNADNTINPGERKRAHVEIEHIKRQIARSTRMKDDAMLDRQYYLDLIQEMLDSPDGLVSDGSGRSWMDIIYSDEQDKFERELWTNRLGKQAALDILFYGRVSVGNMDAILQMPEDQQAETLVLATDYALELQEYQQTLQITAADKKAKGLTSDLKELQFPQTPVEALSVQPIPKIETTGDDLDVYNN